MLHIWEWMWNLTFERFHFSFSSLLSTIPPNPISFLLFFPLFLPICSQGQTFSRSDLLWAVFIYRTTQRSSHLHSGQFPGVPCGEIGTVQGFMDRWLGQTLKLSCLHLIGRMCQYLPAFTLCIVLQNGGLWYLRPHSWEAAEPGLQSACPTHQSLYHSVPSVTSELPLRWEGTVYGF